MRLCPEPRAQSPEPRAEDDKRASADIPIEDKKTFNWIEALRDCVALAPQIPQTQIPQTQRVCVSGAAALN